mmetsp:Transcript_21226/g.47647  ORF Transcript_21226/g.47647 Transcript_21226/m.47647 type:complete len:323 (-) Transcript_21226:1621-2589(-)
MPTVRALGILSPPKPTHRRREGEETKCKRSFISMSNMFTDTRAVAAWPPVVAWPPVPVRAGARLVQLNGTTITAPRTCLTAAGAASAAGVSGRICPPRTRRCAASPLPTARASAVRPGFHPCSHRGCPCCPSRASRHRPRVPSSYKSFSQCCARAARARRPRRSSPPPPSPSALCASSSPPSRTPQPPAPGPPLLPLAAAPAPRALSALSPPLRAPSTSRRPPASPIAHAHAPVAPPPPATLSAAWSSPPGLQRSPPRTSGPAPPCACGPPPASRRTSTHAPATGPARPVYAGPCDRSGSLAVARSHPHPSRCHRSSRRRWR